MTFHRKFPVFEHLLQWTVCGCYNPASLQGFPHPSVALYSIHVIQKGPDPTQLSQSSWAPGDTNLYTANFHQWVELNFSTFSQNLQELSYTNIFRKFEIIRPETSYYSLPSNPETWSSEQPLDKGMWPYGTNSNGVVVLLHCSFFLPSLPKSQDFLMNTIF